MAGFFFKFPKNLNLGILDCHVECFKKYFQETHSRECFFIMFSREKNSTAGLGIQDFHEGEKTSCKHCTTFPKTF